MENLTPKKIVEELDKYIIGQNEAKKMVAIALRNRYRRNLLKDDIKEDIMPKNILMIGPTGVGKTEIARRLAKLINAPFVKVEATKFTEVGYVGRDVDSIIRDLMEDSVRIVKEEKYKITEGKAKELAIERIAEQLAPNPKKKNDIINPFGYLFAPQRENQKYQEDDLEKDYNDDNFLKREQIKKQIENGLLDDMLIEIEIEDNSAAPFDIIAGGNLDDLNINLQDMLGNIFPKKKKRKKVTVKEALRIFQQEEAEKMIDMDDVYKEAKKRAEEQGIVFIDEIDKIAGKGTTHGPDISREGVQRDILPIVEGSTVNTKYGPIKTDYILFIAAGAFHVSKVTDLIPELLGRFPVHVELQNLTKEDFEQILLKPKNALTKQYIELLKTEGIELIFDDGAISYIAEVSYKMNQQYENIGARRLHTVIEEVLKDISFEAPDIQEKRIVIDELYVKEKMKKYIKETDINKYII
ncbi:ATP-dependent protease ATPase subunit HslU [Caloramator sp. E03]|uniref:ATP-dependent protease ATPase subunit HslU n=1 Tax=Caloramator sp. E03 TaxID=2576307 RepID=UPI00111045AD|nr:ATP-dependent protease ATPase subunit HslU [Caloramator sp. E03]QCX32263.1 ATP-dependent protease ATPase subunit HslU [Caloramator sp. E03]